MSLEFGTAFDQPLTEEQGAGLIDGMARAIVSRRMETMAVFLLDAHRPFSFMASQALLVASPLVGAFCGFGKINQWSRILEDRGNLDRLMDRIAELVADRDRRPTENAKEIPA